MCEVVNPCPELGREGSEGGGIYMGRVAGESASDDEENEEQYGDNRGVDDEGQDGGVDESEHRGRRGTKAAYEGNTSANPTEHQHIPWELQRRSRHWRERRESEKYFKLRSCESARLLAAWHISSGMRPNLKNSQSECAGPEDFSCEQVSTWSIPSHRGSRKHQEWAEVDDTCRWKKGVSASTAGEVRGGEKSE
ncbi:hypothetical protein C8R46DRAFT_1027840 [Mycena filopes]|nr:hypothetical protein C8R46DRAFT_1027840 [Mycena filopes]